MNAKEVTKKAICMCTRCGYVIDFCTRDNPCPRCGGSLFKVQYKFDALPKGKR